MNIALKQSAYLANEQGMRAFDWSIGRIDYRDRLNSRQDLSFARRTQLDSLIRFTIEQLQKAIRSLSDTSTVSPLYEHSLFYRLAQFTIFITDCTKRGASASSSLSLSFCFSSLTLSLSLSLFFLYLPT